MTASPGRTPAAGLEILIIAPGGTPNGHELGELPEGSAVRVVSWAAHGGGLCVAEPTGLVAAMRRRAAGLGRRGLIGRTLAQAGPLDEGAVFWRAVRRERLVRDAALHADVVVAADRDGVLTAWRLGRLGSARGSATAVFGYPAARAAITRRLAR